MAARFKDIIKKPYIVFGIGMILFVILCYNVLILHNGYRFLNSDDSSELVLARILASQHSVLTKDWLYSSELRVFNTNLIFAPMFLLFRSWSLVRAVGGSIMLLLYVTSYIAIPYAWKYEAKWFYLTAFILIMPFANPWQFFGLKMYYLPHVFITFVSFALAGLIYHASSAARTAVYTAVLGVFAFIAGLGGARSPEYTYAPLMIAAIIVFITEKPSGDGAKDHMTGTGRVLFASIISAVSSALGYLVNDRILTGIYSYHSYDNVSFIRFTFEKLEWALDCILAAFGYVIGEYFISFGGICNVLAFVMTVVFLAAFIVLYRQRHRMDTVQRYMYCLGLITFLLNTFLMIVGQNDEYADRYIAIGMVPAVMMIDLVYRICIKDNRVRRTVGAMVIVFFLLIGAKGYLDLWHVGGNGERLGYINYMLENGYDYGYATFWNANITTEMSDGAIDMTSLDPNAEKPVIFKWLTDRRLIEGEHEKAALVLTNEELHMYEGIEPVYSDDHYSVFDVSGISFASREAD